MRRFLNVIVRFVFKFLPLLRMNKTKRLLLKLIGHDINNDVVISSSVKILGNFKLIVGKNSFIGHETMFIGGKSVIKIGDNCDISSRVNFVTGTHEIDTKGIRTAGKGKSLDITIGNGVWIGFGATILPGVTIHEKSIIGSGSIVNKDIPPRTVAAGNPCKVIRNLN